MPTAIKCIVHDKRVIEVLKILKPYAIDPPVVDPLEDESIGVVKKQSAPPGTITKLVYEFVANAAKTGKKTVSSKELKAACLHASADKSSYSYGLKRLLEQKKLKRTKHPSTYEVVR